MGVDTTAALFAGIMSSSPAPSSVPSSALSPSARNMLEEVEFSINHGDLEKPRQVLRSLPTPMLSDVHGIYEETKLRSEMKAAMIHERTAEVDANIAAVHERRQELRIARETLEREVQNGFAQLRRTLDEREHYL